jgi:hypothetical protein
VLPPERAVAVVIVKTFLLVYHADTFYSQSASNPAKDIV